MLWLSDQHGLHYLDETGQPQLGLDATSATGSPQIVALGLAQGGSRAVWVAGQRSASLIDTTGIIQRRIDMNTLRGFGPILAVSHYADTTPPSIDIESPIDGSYLNHPELGIVLTYEDEGIGVDLRTLTLTINHHIANLSCEYSHNRVIAQLKNRWQTVTIGWMLQSTTMREIAVQPIRSTSLLTPLLRNYRSSQ